jgi:hypothetical protein
MRITPSLCRLTAFTPELFAAIILDVAHSDVLSHVTEAARNATMTGM